MKNIIKKPKKTELKDNLNYMTVDYLKNIAKVYEVDKAYKMKKQELIDKLFDRLTDENYIIKNLSAYYEYEEHMSSEKNEPISESIRLLGLAKVGLYFLYDLGDRKIEGVIPEEIKKVIDNIEESKIELTKSRYSEVFKYLRAFKNFYGIFEIDFFINIFNEHHEDDQKLSSKELMYYLDKYNIHNNEIANYNDMLVCEALCMFEGDIDQILKGREGKEYYIPEKEELLKYSNDFYIKKTAYYYNLEEYLLKYLKDKNYVNGIIEDINIECVMDTFNIQNTIMRLQSMGIRINVKQDIEKILKLFGDFENNTRKWINKGWTKEDLVKKDSKETKLSNVVISNKVGRNEACPCGSGKKYKKCCGR